MSMRLAYLSPMPPAATGIADYSADLLPRLATNWEIEVFTALRSTDEALSDAPWRTCSYDEFLSRQTNIPYDAVVYQMGNNADFHSQIYDLLLRVPGVVVLHEFVLHHMISERTLLRGDWSAYAEELRYSYGRSGQAEAQRMLDFDIPINPWRFPLFERVVDHARAVLVHNEFARHRILASRPKAAVDLVPSPVQTRAWTKGEAVGKGIRQQLGVPSTAPLIGSFGLVTPLKRLEVSLRAFQRIRTTWPSARYLIVGPVSPFFDLQALLAGDLGNGVVVTGRTSLDEFQRYMEGVDLAINLRFPSAGETSATLMRLMGAGTAVIVNDHGPMAELPDDCCVKVPADGYEELVLTEMMQALLTRPGLRQALGANARRFVEQEHSVDAAVRAYQSHLERYASRIPRPQLEVPPLARSVDGHIAEEVIADLASACADVGVDEDDVEVLEPLGADLADLRWIS